MKPTNAQLRERANAIAAIVAPAIGLQYVPLCHRITRRRGRGRTTGFSVPAWAAAHPLYFNYYAAHEVCHAHLDAGYSHGPGFRAKEAIALAALGLAPIYQNGGKGPYVDALTDLAGNVVCVRNRPGAPCDPPFVYTPQNKV